MLLELCDSLGIWRARPSTCTKLAWRRSLTGSTSVMRASTHALSQSRSLQRAPIATTVPPSNEVGGARMALVVADGRHVPSPSPSLLSIPRLIRPGIHDFAIASMHLGGSGLLQHRRHASAPSSFPDRKIPNRKRFHTPPAPCIGIYLGTASRAFHVNSQINLLDHSYSSTLT